MNPLHWRREYQVAWVAFCILGAMAGLFFAWTESGVRAMVNYTVEGNPSLMLFLWFLRPSRYWQWLMRSMLGIVIIWIVTDALYRYYFVPLIKQWEAGAAAADAKMALAEQKATEFEARFEERVAALNRRSDAVMKRMDEVKAELKQRSDVLKTDAAQFERSKTGK